MWEFLKNALIFLKNISRSQRILLNFVDCELVHISQSCKLLSFSLPQFPIFKWNFISNFYLGLFFQTLNGPLNFHLHYIFIFISIFYSLIWLLLFNKYTIGTNFIHLLSILLFIIFNFINKHWSRKKWLLITHWFIIIIFCFQSPMYRIFLLVSYQHF